MAIDDQIKDEKIHYDIKRDVQKYQPYHQAKLRTMNILQAKRY